MWRLKKRRSVTLVTSYKCEKQRAIQYKVNASLFTGLEYIHSFILTENIPVSRRDEDGRDSATSITGK